MNDIINLPVSRVPTLTPLTAQTVGGILVNILTTVGTGMWQAQWASQSEAYSDTNCFIVHSETEGGGWQGFQPRS